MSSVRQSPFDFVLGSSSSKLAVVTVNLRDTFAPHPSLASELVDGELVLLHLDEGIYYGLDAIGTQTWQHLVAGRSLSAAIGECVAQFPSEPRQRIEMDLLALTQALVDARLLCVSPSR